MSPLLNYCHRQHRRHRHCRHLHRRRHCRRQSCLHCKHRYWRCSRRRVRLVFIINIIIAYRMNHHAHHQHHHHHHRRRRRWTHRVPLRYLFYINLHSNFIYSPSVGTLAAIPHVPFRTPLPVNVAFLKTLRIGT